MIKASAWCTGLSVLVVAMSIVGASAQFPPPPSTVAPPSDATVDIPKKQGDATQKKKAGQPDPGITGTWDGELNQVGSTAPYKFELSITATGAETKYADLDCTGKLTRVGQSKSYVFFIEIVTKGQADKG